MPKGMCSVESCKRPVHARIWCRFHYERWRLGGDPLSNVTRKAAPRVSPIPPCTIASCGRGVLARGWCSVHYARWRSYGDPLFDPPTSMPCGADGCERPTRVGFCESHRHRIRGAAGQVPVSSDYADLIDGTTMLTMTMADGTQCVTVFDVADRPLIEQRTWRVTHQGYVISSRNERMHRLLLGLSKNDGLTGDHVNGDRRDNRRSNLRATSNQRNVAHQAVVNHRGTSRFRNVHRERSTGRWNVEVLVSRKKHWLGSYDTEEEAAQVAAEFRVKHGLPSGY